MTRPEDVTSIGDEMSAKKHNHKKINRRKGLHPYSYIHLKF